MCSTHAESLAQSPAAASLTCRSVTSDGSDWKPYSEANRGRGYPLVFQQSAS